MHNSRIIAKTDNCLSNDAFIIKHHKITTTLIMFVVAAEQVKNITRHIFTLSHFTRTKSVSHKNKTRKSWNVPNPSINLRGTGIHLVNLSDMLFIVLREIEICCKGLILSKITQIRYSRKTWNSLIKLPFVSTKLSLIKVLQSYWCKKICNYIPQRKLGLLCV